MASTETRPSDHGEDYQERLYSLLSKLQQMAREIPAQYQQRISYDLLSSLAASLAQGAIVEIVKMLTEVQQVTEKHLFQMEKQRTGPRLTWSFYVTNNPTEIQVQMYLLKFILKIGNNEV